MTLGERITSPSGRTGANRIVVDDFTFRVEATSTETWVLALGVNTSL